MEDQIFIQHRFTIEQDGLSFSDAIVLPVAEYNALTDKDIEALKEDRYLAWKNAIENPIQVEVPAEEQIANINDQLTLLNQQEQNLISQKTEIEVSVSNLEASTGVAKVSTV